MLTEEVETIRTPKGAHRLPLAEWMTGLNASGDQFDDEAVKASVEAFSAAGCASPAGASS